MVKAFQEELKSSLPSIKEMSQHWHTIVLPPQIPICYNNYSHKVYKTAVSDPGWLFFHGKEVNKILLKKIPRVLKNDRGEANYISTMVFIFAAVLMLAFILDLFSILSVKRQLDHCADQMTKQIQLAGGINGETDQLFTFLCSNIEGAENITYTVDSSYRSPTPSGMNQAIQLGTPFFITVNADADLGGFWNFDLIHVSIAARGSGVSERYWK